MDWGETLRPWRKVELLSSVTLLGEAKEVAWGALENQPMVAAGRPGPCSQRVREMPHPHSPCPGIPRWVYDKEKTRKG